MLLIGIVSAYDCTPANCQSGYNDGGVTCTSSGRSYTCNRICSREAGCGTYGSLSSCTSQNWNVGDSDQGKSFSISGCSEDTSYCYKYYAFSKIEVNDWDPGGWLGFEADSVKVSVSSSQGGSSNSCSGGQSNTQTQTTTTSGRRGRAGPDYLTASYQAYSAASCGGSNDGIGGTLTANLFQAVAPYNTADSQTKTCSGTYECIQKSDCGTDGNVGDRYCSGNVVKQKYRTYSCDSHVCSNSESEKDVETCNLGCSGGQCTQGDCSVKTDCGTDGYIGNRFCVGNDVKQKYKSYTCIGNKCDNTEVDSLIQPCGTKTCSNGVCGDDTCPSGQTRCSDGVCREDCGGDCTPSCSGKECGGDGCGGICATCDTGKKCNSEFKCVEDTPDYGWLYLVGIIGGVLVLLGWLYLRTKKK